MIRVVGYVDAGGAVISRDHPEIERPAIAPGAPVPSVWRARYVVDDGGGLVHLTRAELERATDNGRAS